MEYDGILKLRDELTNLTLYDDDYSVCLGDILANGIIADIAKTLVDNGYIPNKDEYVIRLEKEIERLRENNDKYYHMHSKLQADFDNLTRQFHLLSWTNDTLRKENELLKKLNKMEE